MATKTKGAQLLAEWMGEDGGPTPTEIANGIGASRAAVHAFRNGDYRPMIEIREKLARFSGGRIPTDAWLTDEERAEYEAVKPFSRSAAPHTDAA